MASLVTSASPVQLQSSFAPKVDLRLSQKAANLVVSCLVVAAPRADVETSSRSAGSEVTRRGLALAAAAALATSVAIPRPALADFEESYALETKTVIDKVRNTLTLGKDDPSRPDAVDELRILSNDWVAKYRREKTVAGRPSFSNMYSVLNAISGHYISFGPSYPIPKKRQDRIFEEIDIAERALTRGR